MVIPSTTTTIAFSAIVVAIAIAFSVAVAFAGRVRGETPARRRRAGVVAAVLAFTWLSVTALISASGVLEIEMLPPPLMVFFVLSLGVASGVAYSRLGTRIVTGVPLFALVGFQAFRLPLELVLHQWWIEGTLPVQMTYEGYNYDIVSGILGLVVGLVLWRRGPSLDKFSLGLAWAFNLIGLGLLATVATIAVLSSPIPLRTLTDGPAVLLALHVPYGWIVPFCVGGALTGHLLVFRWLKRHRG